MKKKEYKCISAKLNVKKTEEMLNEYLNDGWSIICVYSDNWFVIGRDKQ